MLFPDVQEVGDLKDALQVDGSKSYKYDDLKSASSGSSTTAMCGSPFGCPREYTTVDISSVEVVSTDGGISGLKVKDNTADKNESSFDFSAFNNSAKISAANPFGFAFITGDVAADYTSAIDGTKFYAGDIFVGAEKTDGSGKLTAKQIAGGSSVKDYTKIIVMRLYKGPGDKPYLQTFNSYNFHKSDAWVWNNHSQTLIKCGIKKGTTDGTATNGKTMNKCPVTGYPYVLTSGVTWPIEADSTAWPAGLEGFISPASEGGLANINMNTEMLRVGDSKFSRFYIYKLSFDDKYVDDNSPIWTTGEKMWEQIEAKGDGTDANKKFIIMGLGSTLPLAYDPIYTTEDYAAAPFGKSAKINLYDKCRQTLISGNNPGFNTGNGNTGAVYQEYADDLGDDKDACKSDSNHPKYPKSSPQLSTAAVYNYPKQKDCTDTLVFWPTSAWKTATASSPFKDPLVKPGGWAMMAHTKTTLFIIFLTLGLVLVIISIVSCVMMKKTPYSKQKAIANDPTVAYGNMMNRLNRQGTVNGNSYHNNQSFHGVNPSFHGSNQSFHGQPPPYRGGAPPAARQWSGSRDYSDRSIEMRTYGDAPMMQQPHPADVQYQHATAADLSNVPPYRPNNRV